MYFRMSRLSILIIVWLICFAQIASVVGLLFGSSCKCKSNNKCNSDCKDYGTKNQGCSSSSDCRKECYCSKNTCSSYCSSGSTNYGTAGLSCSGNGDCNKCKCSGGSCNRVCNSLGYNTYNQKCSTDSACTSCTCSNNRCGNLCASYGTAGQICSAGNNCKTCSCVKSLGKCNVLCSSYGTSGQACSADSDCTTPPVESTPTCSCSSGYCSTSGCLSYGSQGLRCSFNKDCTSCGCSAGKCSDFCGLTVSTSDMPGEKCNFDSDCNSCACVAGQCNIMCYIAYADISLGQSCNYNSDCGATDYVFTTATIMPGTTVNIPTTSEPVGTEEPDEEEEEEVMISFSNLNDSQIIAYLSDPTQDATPCLLNCSSSGYCSLNRDKKLHCVCDEYYTGSACQTDIRPCASQSCLNGGNCTDLSYDNGTFYGYECICPELIYGTNCENKIDICQNVTCSGHGKCEVYDTTSTKCSCFYLYLGENCETESSSMKTVKSVMSASSVIAFIFMGLFYLFFIALDLLDYFIRNKERKKRHSTKITKFFYVPSWFEENAMRSIQGESVIE